jgi:hypothetical protein
MPPAWALLPLVARTQIVSGPGLYGILLGAIGAGAVGGGLIMPWLRQTLGPNTRSQAPRIASTLLN